MTLLDTFIMAFGTEGLGEVAKDINETERKIDSLEREEAKLNETIKKGGEEAENARKRLEEINKELPEAKKHLQDLKGSTGGVLLQLRNVAGTVAKLGASFVAVKKAIGFSTDFADQALEIEEAAKNAKLSIEDFQKQKFGRTIFTRDDINNAKDLEMTMRDLRAGTAQIGANLARMLLPALTKIAKVASKVVDFFVDHGEFIKALLIATSVVIGVLMVNSLRTMGVALWTALAPVLPIVLAITAAIIAFALVAEDIYKWLHGEPSVAELIFGPFEEFKNKVIKGFEDIKEAFSRGVVDGIVVAFQKLFALLTQSFSNFYNEIWTKMPKWLQVLLSVGNPINAIMTLKDSIDKVKPDGKHKSGLDYVPFDGYIAELHKGERVQTADEANDWRSGLMAAKKAINFTASYPLNAIPSGAVSNAYNSSSSNRTINIGDITIQTQATDAQGIAQDLASYIKQAVISLDDGMLA